MALGVVGVRQLHFALCFSACDDALDKRWSSMYIYYQYIILKLICITLIGFFSSVVSPV